MHRWQSSLTADFICMNVYYGTPCAHRIKSLSEKMRWNNAFLRSTEFREALEARECFVHPLYLRAYKSGSYRMVLFLNYLHKWKSKFLK